MANYREAWLARAIDALKSLFADKRQSHLKKWQHLKPTYCPQHGTAMVVGNWA